MFSGVYIILHAATQLMHRWFNPAEVVSASERLLEPECFNLDEWIYAIRSLRHPRFQQSMRRMLQKEDGFESRLAASILAHLQMVHEHQAAYVTLADPRYPCLLREIAKPPLAITVLGDLSLLNRPMVGIVGSRKASEKSIREASMLAMGFADAGFVTVSGGALGCDTSAHWGALQSGYAPTPTVVVFASGLMHLHPRQNAYLFRSICDGRGVLLSERLWWQASLGRDFPVRNRIITGLSQHLFIMQAADCSGAMVTARVALEQNRDVYVMRHDDDDIRTGGSRRLLEDGAQGFDAAADVLRDFSHNQVHIF